MNKKPYVVAALLAAAVLVTSAMTTAVAENKPTQVLIVNVDVWDGTSDEVQKGVDVLVEGNKVAKIAKGIKAPNATTINGQGGTVTPGFIDMHQHVMLNPPEGTAAYQTRWDDAAGGAFAIHHLNHNMLMKGITTVRDIAGDPLDVAKAIDMGSMFFTILKV